jgi:S-DNA-T family DNA segregation ATPase FtsK/SpoIIIE
MEKETVLKNNSLIDSDILNEYETSEQISINLNYADEIKEVINNTFLDFGVDAVITGHIVGPTTTRFSLHLGKNVSTRTIANLITDIQVRLGGVPVRLDLTSKGMYNVGLEVENKVCTTVSFKSLFEALPDTKKYPLAIPLGAKVTNEPIWINLDDAPHILVSGTTGSGKSLFIKSVIMSLVMRNKPNDIRLVLFDPKQIELNRFNDMPHLYAPIVRDVDTAYKTLLALEEEMNDRYEKFYETNCCNLQEYNEEASINGLERLPYIVIIIDEYADLVDTNKDIANPVISLAQKARAAGIHIILATQRPSTSVITGVLKANLPTHIALMMPNATDSMVIIGEPGAEKLAGRGDMLVQSPLLSKLGLTRLQGSFVYRTEINQVVDILKNEYKTTYMIKDKKCDDLDLEIKKIKKLSEKELVEQVFKDDAEENRYQDIKSWVMTQDFMSISRIQRECAVGFNRAGRYFLRLQLEGIISEESTKHGCPVIKHSEK